MKKMMFTLITMLTIATSASAMSYERAREEALFLTDKMAYELNLSDAQYEAAFEINLDYLMGVTSVDDVYGIYWERRNRDLNYILYSWQWDLFRAASYFLRPLYWDAGYWHFAVYARYPHRNHFYYGRPHFYTSYRGGHSWRSNGGHSYYEHHRDHFRPNVDRHQHVGMRDGRNGHGNFSPVRGNHHNPTTTHHNSTTSHHNSTTSHHNSTTSHHNSTTSHHNSTTTHHNSTPVRSHTDVNRSGHHSGNISTRSSSAVGHNMGTTHAGSTSRHGTVGGSSRMSGRK